MHSCVDKVVDHHEGSGDLGVGGHEGEALQLSVIRAPGAGKARGVSLALIKGGDLGHTEVLRVTSGYFEIL